MSKHRVLIYKDRWNGWSIFCNGKLYVLGFITWADELESICNSHYRAMGFGIGVQGWEL